MAEHIKDHLNAQEANISNLPEEDLLDDGKHRPELTELKQELSRERYKNRYRRAVVTTVYTLIIVAAVAILVATLWMPVIQIYGSTMNPTLASEDIVVCRKGASVKRNDIIAFYFNNKILVKRCIGTGGDIIDMDFDGNVTVNGEPLQEPYVSEKEQGLLSITFPYQVPDGKYFVMSDKRSESTDSRNAALGCVADEQILGKLEFRVWPLKDLGLLQ